MGEKKCIDPNAILIWTAFVSIIIAENLTSDEQEFVGNILGVISENILFIQSLNQQDEQNDEDDSNNNDNIKQMQDQIDELKEYIKCLEKRFDE